MNNEVGETSVARSCFEQQPNERAKAFAAFSVYLGLGAERSLATVAKRSGKSKALMRRWSAHQRWPDLRARAVAAHSVARKPPV
jgi:hypothetical protein